MSFECGIVGYQEGEGPTIVRVGFFMQHKVVTDEYETVSGFLGDVQLLLSNSRLFYSHHSDEFKQVNALEADFTQVLTEHGVVSSSGRAWRSSSSSSSASSLASPMHLTLKIPKAHFHFTPPKEARNSSASDEAVIKRGQPTSAKRESKDVTKLPVETEKPSDEVKSKRVTKAIESKGLAKSSAKGVSGKGSVKSSTESKVSSVKQPSKSTPTGRGSTTVSGGRGSATKLAPSTPAVRGKAITRPQAFVEEYAASDDPVKKFLSAVYSHRDPVLGEDVVEPFMQLPSRTLYPEYYKVITQPIDLSTIHKNVEVRVTFDSWVSEGGSFQIS